MSRLPTIPKKLFDLKSKFIPGGKISLIPFNVGLENLLIQVKDAEEDSEKMDAIKQIVQACIQTPNINVDKLPLFVIEETFLRLRQHSIGELIDQQYICTNKVEDKSCDNTMSIQIDLRDFKLIEDPAHTNKIIIHDNIGVQFSYPSIELFSNQGAGTQDEFETIISCIDLVFDGDSVFPAEEHTREELTEFWSQLSLLQKKEVYDKFFLTMPHLHYKKDFPCKKCGHIHTLEFNSVQEVFQ